MKLIYKAKDLIEAHIISGLLKSNNIDSHVGGHYLQGGIGDLAAADFVTINVADGDVKEAMLIIKEYEKNNTQQINAEHNSNMFFNIPFIAIAISIIMLIWLSITFSDYK